MIYLTKPEDFSQSIPVVACFLECGDEFLLLRRALHKPQGGAWGLAAGKIEAGESPEEAMVREMFEETGHRVSPTEFVPFKLYFVRYPEADFTFQVYSLRVAEKPTIRIDSTSHTEYAWMKPVDALTLGNLMPDFDECIRNFYLNIYAPLSR